MKKILLSMLAITMAAFTFTSCEDVPEPYEIPGGGGNTPSETVDPAGSGTIENPYNVAAAIKYINEGGNEETDVYVKGIVVSVDKGSYDPSYGSLKYYISDDGTTANQFRVYNGYAGPNRKKFSGEDALKQGDVVVICGKLMNYNGTLEYTTGNYVVSLNGNGDIGGGDDKPVEGTYINETFASSFGVFTVNNVKGQPWVIDSYGYAKATGYDNASKTTTPSASYLVAQPVNMSKSTEATITFEYILRYVTTTTGDAIDGIANKVLVTKDYTGDPATTKWTDITGTLTEVRDWKTWTKFTAAVPAEIIGKESVVFALYYECETSSGTWEVKNFAVKEGKEEGGNTGGNDEGDITTTNGDFETWVGGLPNNWKTESTAGNATLSQSTDAHSGKYSVKVGGTSSANKRIGYKEMQLKAGEYTMTFYAKAATSTGASVRPGVVPIVDGKAGTYAYGKYTNNISNNEWVQVTHKLTITTEGTYCIVIMNSKNPGADVLIDDFTFTSGETTIIK